jgi:type IV secretion system protein VirB4
LGDYLQPWIGNGQYAALFDNDEDTLSISDTQAFEFQDMESYPEVIPAFLTYLFGRISSVIYNPKHLLRMKQLWGDEIWKFLEDAPVALKFLKNLGLTARKHNGGIALITQSAVSLRSAGIIDLVNEILPTKLLLASPGADYAEYQRLFKLNDRELELYASAIPKRQIFLKTPTRSALLNLNVDPRSSWEYRNDPASNSKRAEFVYRHGYEEGLDRLAKGAAA